MNFSAVILAGGRSSRMGLDKARLMIAGETLLARQLRVVGALRPAEIFISGREGEDYSAYDSRVLFDLKPENGPLGGIERALAMTRSALLLVLAVDLPLMTETFLRKLVSRCEATVGVVPRLDGGLEPLAAIYPKRCHKLVADFLERSRAPAREFAGACLEKGAIKTFRVARADAGCFSNWNTPADVAGLPAVS